MFATVALFDRHHAATPHKPAGPLSYCRRPASMGLVDLGRGVWGTYGHKRRRENARAQMNANREGAR